MKEILNKMKEVKAFANLEVDYNSPMASAQFAAKKRAIEELASLEEEYTNKLIQDTVAIIVTGEESKDFANMSESSGILTSSLESSIIGILDSLNEEIYLNQNLTIDTGIVVSSIIQEIASAGGIRTNGIDLENINQSMYIDSKEKFINTFVGLLLESDPNLFSLIAMVSLSKIALENEVGKKSGVFPVILTANNPMIIDSVRNNNLFKKVIIVSAGQSEIKDVDYVLEKVDENSVNKTLTSIKKSLKEK